MFLDVVTWLQNHCHLEHFKTICVIWWRLWSFRNAFVHGGATPLVSSAMHWSACFVGDCLVKSPAVERGLSRCKDIKWKPPNAGRFKLNTDARIDESLQRTNIGLMIRDSRGLFMTSYAQGLDSLFCPPIVEALAILRSLKLAIEMGLLSICVESDAKVVVNVIISKSVPLLGCVWWA
ncbi:hypothetical protein ACOSQ4_000767 [Xanthoceras sorbifolium]